MTPDSSHESGNRAVDGWAIWFGGCTLGGVIGLAGATVSVIMFAVAAVIYGGIALGIRA